MRSFSFVVMCFVLLTGLTQAELFLHLDSTQPGSIVLEPIPDSNDLRVSQWLDLSGNGRHATAETGDVMYPSTIKMASGFSGLDFGAEYNILTMLSAADADYLLDSSAAGDPDKGFSYLIAVQTVNLGANQQYPMGNWPTNGNFSIMFEDGTEPVQIKLRLQQTNVQNAQGESDTTYVLGVQFDPTNPNNANHVGWVNNVSTALGEPTGDYSSTNARLVRLGGTSKSTAWWEGLIGEIRIWDERLPDEEFAYQREIMTRKWLESRAASPMDAGEAVASENVTLEWTNLLPETEGEDVYVDVYFGTEPNRPEMDQVVIAEINQTIATVSAPTTGEVYYWAVDTSFGSDPNIIEGPMYSFTAVADPAPGAVDAGPDYITWPFEGVPVDAIITDEGTADVTVTFAADDPNVVFDPNPVVIAGGGGVASTVATIDYDAEADIVVTATAEDAYPDNAGITVSDTMSITVYASACQAERIGNGNQPVTDIIIDCVHDFEDFAEIAARWLEDYSADAAYINPVQPPLADE